MIVYSLVCPVFDRLAFQPDNMSLRHNDIKAIVQKAARTQKD